MSSEPDQLAPLFARLRRYGLRARRLLVWERYGPVLAVGLLASALFLAAAVAGVWERLGDPWRLIALLATLFFVARAIYWALPLRFPTRSDAQRRVEADSAQAHRPLDVLADRPALSEAAWPAHYALAVTQAEHIQRPKSRAVLSPIDPYYLRIAAPMLLIGAMIIGAGFGFERIKRAATPSWQAGINPASVSFEAWIDPPAYTGRPPIYFKEGANIIVPAGSEFVARISGASNPPRPKLFEGVRSRFIPLTRLGAQSLEARTTIDGPATAEWRIGLHREIWELNVKSDTAPEVDFVDPPEADKRDRLVFSYLLEDDYGVETLRIEMAEIVDGVNPTEQFNGLTQSVDVPLSSGSVKRAENSGVALDLTKHIWAGRKVIGRLVATDGAGHVSRSSGLAYFTVPDKIFVEPLAKAVIEHRQLVLAGQGRDYARRPRRTAVMGWFNTYEPELRLDRAPATIHRAAVLIDAVTDAPDDIFKDPAVYLGLRNVSSRLRYADETADLSGIPEDLWRIAIRAEFGVLGTALEEMREAEVALRDGMARRAAQREIDTLFDRYNTAVENYTEELRRQALEDGNFAEGGGGGGEGGMQSVDEIEALLKAIEEANAAGDTEGARRALAKLAKLLENMEIQLAKGGSGDGEGMEGEMSEEMKKSLEELADMMGEQRELQDETLQAERSIDEGDESLSPQELAERQAELEALLDKLSGALPSELAEARQGGQSGEDGEGETPGQGEQDGQAGLEPGGSETAEGGGDEPGPSSSGKGNASGEEGQGGQGTGKSVAELLEGARNAMGRSGENLKGGELRDARRAQDDVLRELREAGKLLAETASKGNEEGEGDSDDPLGRSDDGFNNDSSEADIEMRDNATRSRELLEELRRRAAEQKRQKQERDYLERLLKRF